MTLSEEDIAAFEAIGRQLQQRRDAEAAEKQRIADTKKAAKEARHTAKEAAEKAKRQQQQATTPAPVKRNPQPLSGLQAKVFDPIVPIVEDLIPEESVNILYGLPGCGKTFFLDQLKKAIADEEPFLGLYPTSPKRILHCALEYSERQYKEREARLNIQHPERVDYYTADDVDGAHPLTFADIDAWCTLHPGQIVLLDMYKNLPLRVSKSWTIEERLNKLYSPLKALAAKHHVAIVAVAHSNDLGRMYGGPSASGRIDNAFCLVRDKTPKGSPANPTLDTATLTITKARSAVPDIHKLRFNGQAMLWEIIQKSQPAPEPPETLTPKLQEIYDLVAHHDEGLSMQDISTKLQKNHNTIRTQVKMLVDENFLVRRGTLYFAVLDETDKTGDE